MGDVCWCCSGRCSGEELALKASLSSPSDSNEYRGMLSEIEDPNFRKRKGVSEQEVAFPDGSADKGPGSNGGQRECLPVTVRSLNQD